MPVEGSCEMISAQQALARLHDGNGRFVAGQRTEEMRPAHLRRAQTAERQSPFAIILGCSDSRVPPEIVFDQGLGDLFVIRVAGNIVAPSQIGSVEFASAKFGIPLVVVLGHSQCGAVLATLQHLLEPKEQEHSEHSRSIVERIRPAIENLLDEENPGDRDILWASAVRCNVKASVEQLMHGSKVLEQLIDGGQVCIVGAEYSLETGTVEFL